MRRLIPALSLLPALALWGCGGGGVKPDAKGVIRTGVGRTFEIQLLTPAGSDHKWVIVKDFDPKVATFDKEDPPEESDKPGAPIVTKRTYTTAKKGKAMFEAKLAEGGDVKKKISKLAKFQLLVE